MLRSFTLLATVVGLFLHAPLTAQVSSNTGSIAYAAGYSSHASGPYKKVETTNLSAHEASALQLSAENNLHIEALEVLTDQNGEEISLRFTSPRQGNTTIAVYNAMGKRIYKERLKNHTGEYKGTIAMKNASTGVFYLVVEQDRRSLSKKIML